MNALTSGTRLAGVLSIEMFHPDVLDKPIVRDILPSRGWRARNWLRMLISGELFVPVRARLAKLVGGKACMVSVARLYLTKISERERTNYGLVGLHLVVTAGKGFVVDAWQNLVELENMKFHGVGTGTTAPAAGNTALETELTTQYNPDNTRATGSTTEASATVFRTVGTNTFDASAAVTEWGLLSQAATGGGTLFDRQTFSAINVVSGDSIQSTYDLTVS